MISYAVMGRGKPVKLLIRLLPDVNEGLRDHTRYRGDLSSRVMEAVNSIADLEELPVEEIRNEGGVPTTTVSLTAAVRQRLRRAAVKRGVSMNALVNAAVAEWLKAQR